MHAKPAKPPCPEQIALACLVRLGLPVPWLMRLERSSLDDSGRTRWGVRSYILETDSQGRPLARAAGRTDIRGTRRDAETLANLLAQTGLIRFIGPLHCGRYLTSAQCSHILQQLARK